MPHTLCNTWELMSGTPLVYEAFANFQAVQIQVRYASLEPSDD